MTEREPRLTGQEPKAAAGRGQSGAASAKGAGSSAAKKAAARALAAEQEAAQQRHARLLDDAEDDHAQDEREDEGINGEYEELSDDERFDLFLGALDQSVLPDLPKMPGYHVCWLTTTHQSDTIPRRLRLGYTLVRAEELGPEWQSTSLKTGEYAGCVAINEMIAAKIPLRQYDRYMAELHHVRPLSEEEKLRAAIDQAREDAESRGAALHEGTAMADLVRRAKMPSFVSRSER